jgi:hypothetical protein
MGHRRGAPHAAIRQTDLRGARRTQVLAMDTLEGRFGIGMAPGGLAMVRRDVVAYYTALAELLGRQPGADASTRVRRAPARPCVCCCSECRGVRRPFRGSACAFAQSRLPPPAQASSPGRDAGSDDVTGGPHSGRRRGTGLTRRAALQQFA